jgi:hypothetical protein
LKKDLLIFSDHDHQRFVIDLKCGQLYFAVLPKLNHEMHSISDMQQVITIDEHGVIGCHQILRKSTVPEIPFTVEVDPSLKYKRYL